MEVSGPDGVSGPGECGLLGRGEHARGDGALVGCLGCVVAFDDLGSDPFPADQLLLGAQQVREAISAAKKDSPEE